MNPIANMNAPDVACPVTYFYNRRELRDLMEKQGFHVKQIQAEHIFPYRIQGYIQNRFLKERYFRWLPEPLL
jgi:hypothetical protein